VFDSKASRRSFTAVVLFWALLPAFAEAQTDADDVVETERADAEVEETSVAWTGALSVAGNVNVTSNSDVVGQNDGLFEVFGLGISGDATYADRPDELRLELTINETFARTPSIGEFVKNTDSLQAEGIYNRFLADWGGLFGLAGVETTIFQNFNVTGSPTNYRILRQDGSESTRGPSTRFQLSDPFKPTSLNQSVGLFANPYESTPITVRTRLGLGARETLAEDVLVVDDDPDTSELDARELESVFQGGVEAFLGASGEFPEQQFTYEFGATTLLPVLNDDPENRSATDLIRYGVSASLTFSAFDWLSASYNLDVTRNPQLIEATQIQNNVLLSIKYTLIEQTEEAEDEPTPKEKLEDARNRIETLEQRIQEIESESTAPEETDGESSSESDQRPDQ